MTQNMKLRQNRDSIKKFQGKLLRWYSENQRVLPWRANPTPYRVWISEIMLQQTQVKTVVPYYNRFLKRFPNIELLAEASEQEVMKLWAGLGYYRRARNLHVAARQIVRKHGIFPKEYKTILALPGVGRYTAGAICSLAFNQPQPVLDGNVRRVLIRLSGITRRATESYFWNQMSTWLPERESSSFNQAMMELGALVCVPSQPRCPRCPVRSFCRAWELGIQNDIPRSRPRHASRHLRIVALVLRQNRRILLASSGKGEFIPGKWGLPNQIVRAGESAEEVASVLCRKIFGFTIPLAPCAEIRHSISHHRLFVRGFYGETCLSIKTRSLRWADFSPEKMPFTSSLFRKVLLQCRERHQRAKGKRHSLP